MSERSTAKAPAQTGHDGRGTPREANPQAASPVADSARRLASTAGNRAVTGLLGPGRPLADELRLPMEARFGEDFSAVRIHDHPQAHDSARAHAAKAYTHGEHIVFGAQRFAPQRPEGRHLLAHELAHVVQQRRGGAAPQAGAPTEQAASAAADVLAAGSGPVAVAGASGVGVACEKDDEEERKKKGLASTTVMGQKPMKPGVREQPIQVIDEPKKGKGTLGEVTVPFDRYSGPEWNHIGGGSETASSRTSIARNGSNGIDFLVENTQTGRLVIGEQKATDKPQFSKTTAITSSLEDNVAQAAQSLREQLKSGQLHPDEAARLERTIKRLDATHEALTKGTELPPGVVFELTNVAGEGRQIGENHVDLLAKKYGDKPAFLEHLLSRTFVRDPALAKASGRDPKGKPGTDADPGVVPALDLLTEPARNELARLKSGKSQADWDQQQAADKAAKDAQQAKADADAAKARMDQQKQDTLDRNAAKKQQQDDAAEAARAAKLKDLHEQRKKAGTPDPKNKTAQKKQDSADRRQAQKAATDAKKQTIADQQAAARQQEAADKVKKQADADAAAQQKLKAETDAEAARQAYEAELAKARKTVEDMRGKPPEDWDKLPKAERQRLERLATDDKLAPKGLEDAQKEFAGQYKDLHTDVNARQKQDFDDHAQRSNQEAEGRNRRKSNDEKMSSAAHRLNQAAGAVRGLDAFLDARDRGKGYGEAAFDAGKTYLENTNQYLGALATFDSRMQKEKLPDGREQQYYGNDAGDAFFGTLGENIAGAIVPGKGWDQLVNGGANLIAAGDDHLKRDLPPGDPARDKANIRTGTDLAAELTPSRMFATTIGAGMRAWYDLDRASRGDASGVDKFGEDAVRGKLGSIIQPWAMGADFLGNLGGDNAGVALDKTLKKSKDTTLAKLGNALGDGMYELGESKDAKAGKYGGSVQGLSMMLGMSSDMIAGKTFEQALNKAADAGKGSALETAGNALGDAAFKTVETGKEVYAKGEKVVTEDIPALKQAVVAKAEETYDKGKAVVTEDLPALKEAVVAKAEETYDKGKAVLTEDLPALKEQAKERAKQEYSEAREKLSRWWNN